MKTNFKCPKCKQQVKVGKKLRASYQCPKCKYSMVLTKEDITRGTQPYRSWFKTEETSYKKPYKKFHKVTNN